MKREHEISDELKKTGSQLADLSFSMPYQVPEGYFENFTSELNELIKDLDNEEVIPAWGKTLPYHVPAPYFNELTNNIVASAMAAEPNPGYTKNLPYTIPAGYFESLPDLLLAAAKATDVAEKEIRSIPIKRRISILPKRWAAAAVILITIGLGSYEFFYTQPASPEKILATVPANDIQEYLQRTVRLDVDRVVGSDEINNIPLENNEIIEYLNESGWD